MRAVRTGIRSQAHEQLSFREAGKSFSPRHGALADMEKTVCRCVWSETAFISNKQSTATDTEQFFCPEGGGRLSTPHRDMPACYEMLRDRALLCRVINLWVSQDEGEFLYKLSLLQLLSRSTLPYSVLPVLLYLWKRREVHYSCSPENLHEREFRVKNI
jgi:hypothetical protein